MDPVVTDVTIYGNVLQVFGLNQSVGNIMNIMMRFHIKSQNMMLVTSDEKIIKSL